MIFFWIVCVIKRFKYFSYLLGPASPIVERPSPLPGGGLNISWKSDVTSRQEEYAVRYVRNDTEEVQTIKTRTPRIKLENLYPGAGYEIKVTVLNNIPDDFLFLLNEQRGIIINY